jgi:hypothetical protein
MNKLKKEIFRRGTRMVHRFDSATGEGDPLGQSTFDPGFPIGVKAGGGSRALTMHKDGEHRYDQPLSPIVKYKGGKANLNGPAPDNSDMPAQTIPLGTVKRTPFKPVG